MTGHTFGARLFFLRHFVKGISRSALASEVNRVAPRYGPTEELSASEIREWERTNASPSEDLRGLLCKVMGFSRSLLDPESKDWRVSPEWFLRIAKLRGWGQLEIAHNWRLLERGLAFEGEPNDLEFERILDTYRHRFVDHRQRSLFFDEFWCTHCGHWQSDAARICPRCGNEE